MTILIFSIAAAAAALSFILTIKSELGGGLSARMHVVRFGSGLLTAAAIAAYFFVYADPEPFRQTLPNAPRINILSLKPLYPAFFVYFGIAAAAMYALRFTPWHLPRPRSFKERLLRNFSIYAPDIDRGLIRKWWLAVFVIWIISGAAFFTTLAVTGVFER